MAQNDTVLSAIPIQNGLLSVKNTDGTNALTPGMTVTLDASNLLSSTQPVIGVKQATADDVPFGICREAIALGAIGSIYVPFTAIVPAIASGAITANTYVEADTGGKVKTCAAGKPAYGVAVQTTSSNNDQLLVAIPGGARNA